MEPSKRIQSIYYVVFAIKIIAPDSCCVRAVTGALNSHLPFPVCSRVYRLPVCNGWKFMVLPELVCFPKNSFKYATLSRLKDIVLLKK